MSDTNPLPASEFRRLADAMMNAASHLICQSDVAEDDEACANESAVQDTIEAYRAARSASPVTLEEALLIEERVTHKRAGYGADPDLIADWEIATAALEEHARRLAGEGGAA